MPRTVWTWLTLGTVLATACTVSRQGTLSLMPEGKVIPVEVKIDDEGVAVEGHNPETGERLAGRLEKVVAETERGPTAASVTAPLPGGIAAAAPAAGRESSLNVSGTLSGDLGTVLRCMVVVERRLYLKGSGICKAEGTGDGARTFRLVF